MASISVSAADNDGLTLPFVSSDGPTSSTSRSSLDSVSDARGSWMGARSRLTFVRDLQISMVVAASVVLLSLPFIIYPISEAIDANAYGCSKKTGPECHTAMEADYPVCRWDGVYWHDVIYYGKCEPTKKNVVLATWGALILQFIFSLHSSLGKTIRLSVQGFVGTFMAWLNVMLLNLILPGGAFAHGKIHNNSAWLPLCSYGTSLDYPKDSVCFLNIEWTAITFQGFLQVAIVWVDFILFVVAFLIVGSDSNTRMFALSTHVYFMMTFVDPTDASFYVGAGYSGFLGGASNATQYTGLIGLACILAVGLFLIFPRRYTKALESAEDLESELVYNISLVIKSMHGSVGRLTRQKAKSVLEVTEIILQDFEDNLNIAWHEIFGTGRRARRSRLRHLGKCVRNCMQRIPCVHHIASSASSDAEQLGKLTSLGIACEAGSHLLTECWFQSREGALSSDEELLSNFRASLNVVSQDFAKCHAELSPDASAFVSMSLGVLFDVAKAVSGFTSTIKHPKPPPHYASCCARSKHFFQQVVKHFGFALVDRSATHPRFVLRYTIAISLAFGIGWVGIPNVFPPYASYSASTIAVIVYTYTGASMPVTMKRVCGVVFGKVIGTIGLLMYGVQTWYYALTFAITMWVVVSFNFFHYLHADKDTAYVACLTAAYAAQGMIGEFRTLNAQTMDTIGLSLFYVVVEMVVGVAIMFAVDILLSSRATKQARHRLQRTLLRTKRFTAAALRADRNYDPICSSYKEDLDALLQLIPYAAAEPMYWREPFKVQLYKALERRLRNIGTYASILHSALDLFGSAESTEQHTIWNIPSLHRICEPQLLLFRRNVWEKMSEVEALVQTVCRDSREDDAAYLQLRKQLEENLYTVAAITKLKSAYQNRTWMRRGRDSTRTLPTSSRPSRCCVTCCQLFCNILRTEPLSMDNDVPVEDEDAITKIGGAADLSEIRDLVLSHLDEDGGAHSPEVASLHPLACAELVIFLVKSILSEIDALQFELLEY